MEYRPVGLEAFIEPAGVGVSVVPAGALGRQTCLTPVTKPNAGFTRLAALNSFSSSMGGKPEAYVSARLVVGDHPVVDEAGNADGALCVAYPAGR